MSGSNTQNIVKAKESNKSEQARLWCRDTILRMVPVSADRTSKEYKNEGIKLTCSNFSPLLVQTPPFIINSQEVDSL